MEAKDVINRLNIARYAIYGSIVMEIGHEINNHLNSISLSSQIIELYAGKGNTEDLNPKLEIINNNIESIQKFTQKMISIKTMLKPEDFSREKWDLVNPNAAVRDAVNILGSINRFDRVEISLDDLEKELYLFTSNDVFDLIISVLLLNISSLVREGSISFAGRKKDGEKHIRIKAVSPGEKLSHESLIFPCDIGILNGHLAISHNLLEDVLRLCGAFIRTDDEGEGIYSLSLIYS